MSIITSQPVSRTEDSRYVTCGGLWTAMLQLRADRGEVCPNKRPDRRQEHPQASQPAPPLCLHKTEHNRFYENEAATIRLGLRLT